MKLIKGKSYGTLYGKMEYGGILGGIWFNCDICHKERMNTHEFYTGPATNPNEVWHLGSECVKKFLK